MVVLGTKNNIVTHLFIKYLLKTYQSMCKHWARSLEYKVIKCNDCPRAVLLPMGVTNSLRKRLGYNTNATGIEEDSEKAPQELNVACDLGLERSFRWRIGQNIQGNSSCQGREA